jgi:hypothetical protein
MMKALVLDMPDDPAAQAPWLDRRLVGSDLAALVAELDAIHRRAETAPGPPPGPLPIPTLDTVLGGNRRALLDRGLSVLPRHALGTLLRHPRLLLELQEAVLLQGGTYWQELNRSDPAVASGVAAVWNRVSPRIPSPAPERRNEAPSVLRAPQAARQALHNRLVLAWAILASVAATILALLHAGQPSPWGWNRPGVLVRSESESPAAYFNRLADTAREWFDERPATADDLARRLGAFRADCTRVIVVDQGRLPPAQRAWLVEHCRTWASRLDRVVHDLEQGVPVDRVQADADAIMNRLIDTLRGQARSIS